MVRGSTTQSEKQNDNMCKDAKCTVTLAIKKQDERNF